MFGVQLIAAVILFSLIEATRNKHLIDRGTDPHNWRTYTARAVVLLALPFLSPYYYLIKLISSMFLFWWCFDVILNILRGKPPHYLSDRGIDALQKKYPHGDFWFLVKAILAVAAVGFILRPDLLIL